MNEQKWYSEHCQLMLFPHQCSGTGFTLNGVSFTNNSIVNITEIRTGSAALFCNTTLPQCCYSHQGGGWFLPNGNVIIRNENLPYYRTRAGKPGAILLHRNSGGTTTGIFRCDIPAAGDNQNLYVGIYTNTTGESCALSCWLAVCKESIFQEFVYTINSIIICALL